MAKKMGMGGGGVQQACLMGRMLIGPNGAKQALG